MTLDEEIRTLLPGIKNTLGVVGALDLLSGLLSGGSGGLALLCHRLAVLLQ